MAYFLFIVSFVFCVACKTPVFCETPSFENGRNHYSGKEIEEIAIMGDRCSGTVYVQTLLKKNFPKYSVSSRKFAFKHLYPWLHLTEFQIPLKEGAYSSITDPELTFLQKSPQPLFVYIVKNVYDSMPLIYKQESIKNEGFIEWLTTTSWTFQSHRMPLNEQQNPYTGQIFNGFLEQRSYKIMNFLQIGSLVDNFIIVRYEDLIQNPEGFINFVAKHYSMLKKESFQNVANYKLEFLRSLFLNEKKSFSEEEIDCITQNLNWDVERLIDYNKRI